MIREVVHSILEADAEGTARRLADAPVACGLVELRADRLRAADVAGLVGRAGRPVVVTVRSAEDGGSFDGSTEEKRSILAAARRAGAAFADVEWNGPLRGEAFGPDAARTILSHHGAPCDDATLDRLHCEMASTHAARLKIVPEARRASDIGAVKRLLERTHDEHPPLAAFASGAAGSASRIFALAWGSWGTYGAAERGRETAAGQPPTLDLLEVYRVRSIGEGTRRFALFGSPVLRSPSPALYAAGFAALALDAVYVPVETADPDDAAAVAELLGLEGCGVTIPLKEALAARCARLDPFASCGSVNTIRLDGSWAGFNTDAPAALELTAPLGSLEGRAVAIAGAGGTARAIAAALARAGATVTLYGRNEARRRAASAASGAAASPWEALASARWDLLVHATPLGRNGEAVLPADALTGRMVLDAAYAEQPTPLIRDAHARGLLAADGHDLLVAQAARQFEILTKRILPEESRGAAAAPWRSAGRA